MLSLRAPVEFFLIFFYSMATLFLFPISTKLSSSGSASSASIAPITSGEVGVSILTEVELSWEELVEDAQRQVLGEIEVLRNKVEAVRAQIITLVSDLITRISSLEQRLGQGETVESKQAS